MKEGFLRTRRLRAGELVEVGSLDEIRATLDPDGYLEGVPNSRSARPDYILILPWNLKDEITSQLANVRKWGGRFAVPIPEGRVID